MKKKEKEKEKEKELQVIDNTKSLDLLKLQDLSYAEVRPDKKTGALVQTVQYPNNLVIKSKKTKTGGQIGQVVKSAEYSNSNERNNSIRDLGKNGVKQKENALAHNVSQATVSRVVNKKK